MRVKLIKTFIQKKEVSVFLLLGVFFLAVLLFPFLVYSPQPLGYDTGFYRRYLINPFVSILNIPVPGLDHTIFIPRIILDIARLLGFSPDITLYGSYIGIVLLSAVAFYYLVREYIGKKGGIIATILFISSPVVYVGYWFMLYKNFIAVIFLFVFLLFLKKRKYIPVFILSVLIPLTHQSTTIFFLCLFVVLISTTSILEKRLPKKEIGIFVATLLVYLYLHPHVQQKIDAPPVGVFLEKLDFLLLTLPLLVTTFVGLFNFYPILKRNLPLLSFGVVSLVFPLFSLPYYQRIFLFTNFFLIIGGAVGILFLLEKRYFYKNKYPLIMVLVFIFSTQALLLAYQMKERVPLVSEKIIDELSALKIEVPEKSSIITTPELTPWVQGQTLSKVYAPGILKDTHTSSDWQMYWSGSDKDKITFLSTFPKPLYIFINDNQRNIFIPNSKCIQKISNMLYRDDC